MADRVEPADPTPGGVPETFAAPRYEPAAEDAAHQLGRAPDPAVLARLERLRPALAEATREVQSLTFLLLFVGLYIGVVAGTTTHRMLLVGAQIQMPFLGVGVNLVGAYILAPILFLLLYFWLLRTLIALGTRVTAYQRDLALLPEPWAGEARRLVPAFPYLEWRLGSGRQALAGLICLALYAFLPIALLLLIQLKFLPYQHDWITPWHMACIVGCVALVWTTWGVIDEPARSRPRRILGALGLLGVLAVSVVLWLDQRPPVLASIAPGLIRLVDSTGWQGYAWSRLIVRDRILMAREPASDLLAEARAGKEGAAREAAETEVFLDRDLAEPLDLRGRNLRRADLTRSRLLGVVIEGTDLSGAMLVETDLQRAHGDAATKLQGADLSRAKLQRASLREVQLQGATLNESQLQGAALWMAQLEGAALRGAQLQGADLPSAQLRGANLNLADAQGTELPGAQLQGATLWRAQLQGAELWGAELQGAYLQQAKLQGANFSGAKLQGADLLEADIWWARMDWWTDLSLARLEDTSGRAPGSDWAQWLREAIERDAPAVTRDSVLARLEPILDHADRTWDPVIPPRADAVFLGDDPDHAVAELVGPGIALDDYRPKLAAFLADLACGDRWIALGIARRITASPDPWSARALVDARCLAVEGLDADLLSRLRQAAAHAP